ncbi:MAG: ribosome-binding factor A [Phycisphaerae bacterium]|nr:ribosome-binding factor A [Phycisphaerae bacterium]
MKSRKRIEVLRALCEEPDPDDGIDPRDLDTSRGSKRNKKDRKAMQLCRQVLHALSLALASECHDDLLLDVDVMAVEPAPDATHLRVIVNASRLAGQAGLDKILQRLERRQGRLRHEVAAAITRKKTPTLSFEVVMRQEEPS